MKYEDLITTITKSYRPDYYLLLAQNDKAIMERVKETSQKQVAKELNISEAKFSIAFNMMLAYNFKSE
jgi:hypothetical protein